MTSTSNVINDIIIMGMYVANNTVSKQIKQVTMDRLEIDQQLQLEILMFTFRQWIDLAAEKSKDLEDLNDKINKLNLERINVDLFTQQRINIFQEHTWNINKNWLINFQI